MPTISDMQQMTVQRQGHGTIYRGPTIYRGEKINQRHSMRKVARTIKAFMDRSGFASASIIGHPGSGKSTCVQNLVTDIVELAEKEEEHYEVYWAGANELRNLHEYFDSLPKNGNAILIFDDVSKALDKLSGNEQADVFEALTTTRHVLGGKHAIISIYHYSYANLKSVRGQAQVTVYTSASLVEMGNILQQMGKNSGAAFKLRKFAKLYENAFLRGEFELNISPNEKKKFIMEKPFRPCFVLNMTGAHIALYMKIDNNLGPKLQNRKKIDSAVLLKKIEDAYGDSGNTMFRLLCVLKGHPEVYSNKVISAWKFVQDLAKEYQIDFEEIGHMIKKQKKQPYRKHKLEKQMRKEIIQETNELVPNTEERDLL